MDLLKDKKIPFLLILVSILMLIFGFLTKDFEGKYLRQNLKLSLEYYHVDIFGISFDYVNFILFFIITLGIGVYLITYKNDQSLKIFVKNQKLFFLKKTRTLSKIKIIKPEFLGKIKNKSSEFENLKLHKKDITKTELPKENQIALVAAILTSIIALVFTFLMAYNFGFSLWFFIIYAYFQYLNLAPKSKKEITIKSICYPLIFLFIFAINESGNVETIMGIEIEKPFNYYLGKHFMPFMICVIIMFFSLRKQFGSKPKFSVENPLFWISLICFLISIFSFIIHMQNN